MKLGQKIAYLRNKKYLTQDQIAKTLGIKRARYNAWENGISHPDHEKLVEIAKFHKVSVDYLLDYQFENEQSTSLKEDNNLYYTLTKKDERDIIKELEKLTTSLEFDGSLTFYNEPMDEATKRIMQISLENLLRLAKELTRKKFAPKNTEIKSERGSV